MKICVAQTRPFKGDIARNIVAHERLIGLAISQHADAIIFPELSLTGYEPTLAATLATSADDPRLDTFQRLSDSHSIFIAVGLPTKTIGGVAISLIIFQPRQTRKIYSKKYLHADEEPFFVAGENLHSLTIKNVPVSLAICYELSIPEHAQAAHTHGSSLYIASVAKFSSGVAKAIDSLSTIAQRYGMVVMMSNCIGECDGGICAGKSSIGNSKGELLKQLDDSHEGILGLDTESMTVSDYII